MKGQKLLRSFLALFLSFFFLLIGFSYTTTAWSQLSHWSQTVNVSTSSATGGNPRENALETAQKSALQKLLATLGVSPEVSPKFIAKAPSFVKDLEILEEKFVDPQYRARVSVTFHRELLEKELIENHLSFNAQALERPPLVIAVELADLNDTLDLHKEDSLWPQQLQATLENKYPAIFPLMDQEDMSFLKDLGAQSTSCPHRSDLLKRYDTNRFILLTLSQKNNSASLLGYEFSDTGRRLIIKEEVTSAPKQLFDTAAQRIAFLLTKVTPPSEALSLQLLLHFHSFDQWSKIMTALSQLNASAAPETPGSRSLEMTVTEIKKNTAQVIFPLSIPVEDFQEALTSQGLKITPKSGYLDVSV